MCPVLTSVEGGLAQTVFIVGGCEWDEKQKLLNFNLLKKVTKSSAYD